MNLRDLEYVLALAELGHFGQAAERCHCTQSTLSGQLKKLEDELGAPLFERIAGGAKLTPFGEQCLEPARAAMINVQRLHDLGTAARDPFTGSLRLGAIPTIGPYLWPSVLPVLRKTFPTLTMLLREEQTRVLLGSLRDGHLDAGVLALPADTQGLAVEALWAEPFVLLVPTRHPLAKHRAVTLEALAGSELLLLEDGHCLREQALAVCRLAGAHERDGFRATSLESLRQMVRAGTGVTLMPQSALMAEPGVAAIALRDAPTRQVGLAYRPNHPRGAVLARLGAALRAGNPLRSG